MRRNLLLPVLAAVLFAIAGCSPGGPASPSVPPSSSPSSSPSAAPLPTPSPSATAAALDLQVFPAEEPTAIRMAIPGSRYAFLVLVGGGEASDKATITASATGAKIAEISPSSLAPGVVGEVFVVADPATAETSGTVTITATRAGVSKSVVRTLPVFPMADERAKDAAPYHKLWVSWLAANHPELGITTSTKWQPVFASTLLVVSHYSYWSPEWEMTVAWHNMIAPYDWTEVHLRRRGVDTAPSMAFRQDSVSGKSTPHAAEPPAEVVR